MASSALAANVGVVSGNQLYERTIGEFRQGVANTAYRPELNSAAAELILVGRGKSLGEDPLRSWNDTAPNRAIAGFLAKSINLLGIVGAFLAGLAVNAAVHDKPAKEKLEFFGTALFILIFFIVTGFLIDPLAFAQSITTNFPLASAVILALLAGKWLAAQIVGRAFGYTRAERMTVWSLTLPQVAATLAAALVAYNTFNPTGQRLIDSRLLNVVLVVMLT